MRIVVLGYIIRGPLGGLAWHHMQYVLGLKQLGHEVFYLEDSDDYPSCYNPETFEVSADPTYGLKFINDFFSSFDLKTQWAYFDGHTNTWHGSFKQNVIDFCSRADIVLNLSGVNPFREWWATIPLRLLIDTDPAFTQIKHLTDKAAMDIAKAHTHYYTFGENFGKKNCTIPDDGFSWKPTRQPVCLDIWPFTNPINKGNWTTVMQWDSYKSGEYDEKIYGMKSLSFKPFISLPKFVSDETLELALGSVTAPKDKLRKEGWKIIDPLNATKTPKIFQRFISQSKGEWTIAKHGYVITKSGWFSERTVNYMASGKPVIVQDTGFTDIISTGDGILVFSTIQEAAEQIKTVNGNYSFHCMAARKTAEDFFEAGQVLSSLLKRIQ